MAQHIVEALNNEAWMREFMRVTPARQRQDPDFPASSRVNSNKLFCLP